MFLESITSALRQDKIRHLHSHWTSLVTSCLPFLGRSLTATVLEVSFKYFVWYNKVNNCSINCNQYYFLASDCRSALWEPWESCQDLHMRRSGHASGCGSHPHRLPCGTTPGSHRHLPLLPPGFLRPGFCTIKMFPLFKIFLNTLGAAFGKKYVLVWTFWWYWRKWNDYPPFENGFLICLPNLLFIIVDFKVFYNV